MVISLLIVGSFIFTIANRLYSKYALNNFDTYAFTILSNLVAALIFLPFAWGELPTLKDFSYTQFLFLGFLGLLWVCAAWLINASIAQNDFSFKEIIRQTRVVWVVLAGVLLLNEQIALADVIGIFCIVASVFIISFKQFSFREHVTSRPIILAWSSSILLALITVLEKIFITTTSVSLYTFFAFLLPALFYFRS